MTRERSAKDRLLATVLDKATGLNERMRALAEETRSGRWEQGDVVWVRSALIAVETETTKAEPC
jgi:hypothetical protein